MKNKKGFTLIELLIVVAIIGIIAAIAIPNLLRALQNGKQTRTMGDMKSIATGIEMYRTNVGQLPDGGSGIARTWYDTTAPALGIIIGDQRVERDGWSNPFYIACDRDNDDYTVGSAGKGGVGPVMNQAPHGTYVVLALSDFEHDIIYSNGAYVYSPRK